MNAYHRRIAEKVIKQANNRTKSEARNEKRKINSLPVGRLVDPDKRSYRTTLTPKSTVGTLTNEDSLDESWIGDGFTFSRRMK